MISGDEMAEKRRRVLLAACCVLWLILVFYSTSAGILGIISLCCFFAARHIRGKDMRRLLLIVACIPLILAFMMRLEHMKVLALLLWAVLTGLVLLSGAEKEHS